MTRTMTKAEFHRKRRNTLRGMLGGTAVTTGLAIASCFYGNSRPMPAVPEIVQKHSNAQYTLQQLSRLQSTLEHEPKILFNPSALTYSNDSTNSIPVITWSTNETDQDLGAKVNQAISSVKEDIKSMANSPVFTGYSEAVDSHRLRKNIFSTYLPLGITISLGLATVALGDRRLKSLRSRYFSQPQGESQ